MIEQLELVADGNRSDFAGFLEPLLYATTAFDCPMGMTTLVPIETKSPPLVAVPVTVKFTVSFRENRNRCTMKQLLRYERDTHVVGFFSIGNPNGR